MSGNIKREESALILTHSNIVIVKNVVRDKKIDKRKNFSGNSNDSFFLAQFRLMRPKPITKRIFTIFNRNPRNLTKNRFYVGIAGKNFL